MIVIENQFPEVVRFEIFTGSLSIKNLAFYKTSDTSLSGKEQRLSM
jgi:hypothetical protein